MKIRRDLMEQPSYLESLLDSVLTDLTSLKASLDATNTHLGADGIITPTVLDPGSTTSQIETTAFTYRIDGMPYAKAAVTAGTAFTAADTINVGTATGTFWGVWLVQINAAGTISTLPGGGLADQVYTTEAEAIAALPDPTAANVAIGYLTIAATADAAWTAQTDDIVSGSDNTSVTFYPAVTSVPTATALVTET
jgi:hypothetical protein